MPKLSGPYGVAALFVLISAALHIFAFLVGYLTGKLHSLTTIFIGIITATVATYALGLSMNGWGILAIIGLFSFGEMMSAPTKMRYVASIAPPGKDGLYMGYANFTVGIGWSLGSILAGNVYQNRGDKVELARKYLVEKQGLGAEEVAAVEKGDLLGFFEKTVGVDAWETRSLLWETYDPYYVWQVFALIGVFAMLAIWVYNYCVKKADANPDHGLNTRGGFWVRAFLIPICLIMLAATIWQVGKAGALDSIGLILNTVFFGAMLAFSLADKGEKISS